MKDRLWGLARLLIILVGMGILVYPSVSEYLSEKNSSVAVSTYDDSIRRMEQTRIEELRAQAEAYNQRLAESNGFSKPALDEYNNPITPEDYWDILDVDGNGMMGYISIPRINVTIPVYHGTSEEVLQVAVGHMQNTSLPVGGENTHAVLSGHRGLPSKALFTDLDQVQIGDVFYLTVLNETLYYQVDQILTVLPNETDALAIAKVEDHVTLVTCTPYGVNSHRLLVRGTRMDYTPETGEAAPVGEVELSPWMKMPMQYRHLLLGLAVLAGILLLRALVVWIRKKFREGGNPQYEIEKVSLRSRFCAGFPFYPVCFDYVLSADCCSGTSGKSGTLVQH